jgi:hypothetical protein
VNRIDLKLWPVARPATIRAELIGSDACNALGIVAHGNAPLLGLCRKLIDAGIDPTTALQAYRGDMLCLIVCSIGETTGLRVNPKGTGSLKADCAVPTAPLAHSNHTSRYGKREP